MPSASELLSATAPPSAFILNYVVNATWQIAAIATVAALGSLLLRNGPARYRHVLWLAALALSVAIPFVTTLPLRTVPLPNAPLLNATRPAAANQSLQDVSQPKTATPLGRVNSEPDSAVGHLTRRRTQSVSATSQTVLWLAFAYSLLLLWRATRLIRFWMRKETLRRAAEFADLSKEAEAVARRCGATFGIRNVEVAQSSAARVPYTIGARRPLIVLPEAFCSADEERLLSMIGHEMAHVARRDYLTNLICELALVPISFHPLAFLIKRQIDRARELACDELVSKRLLPPKLYARSLVWAASVSSRPRSQALMLSMFDARSLEERVMRLTYNRKCLTPSIAKALTSLTLCALFAAAVALSLFSLELKTEARAVVTPSSTSTLSPAATLINTNGLLPELASIPPQQPRTGPQQPVTELQSLRGETRLDAPNAQQRAEAACAAGRNGDTEQIPALIAMLADDAKTELIRCWNTGRWSPALETFKHPSPGEQAAIALASMGHAAFLPLTNKLDSGNATVRRNAAWAIGELTNMPPGERDDAAPLLIALLTDSDAWVRMAAARTLGELRYRSAVPALVANLGDADARVRELSVWALSELKDKRAVAALCNVLLSDLRADVRRGAADALGEIASREALPWLKQALNDPAVSARAQWAISEIEGE
jgi:beta-lactamase regulating signal transducer with metallopeptidase domain